MRQLRLLREKYKTRITVSVNRKGVLDVDTVKGCTLGMAAYPHGGCYGLCYANSASELYGWDFPISVSRRPTDSERRTIEKSVRRHKATWFRIGNMGDPCHDWDVTVEVCEWLHEIKIPVVVSKHWIVMSDDQLSRLAECGVVFNTSISAMDTRDEIQHRLGQWDRIRRAGAVSRLRIVSAKFGDTQQGRAWEETQDSPARLPATKPQGTQPPRPPTRSGHKDAVGWRAGQRAH